MIESVHPRTGPDFLYHMVQLYIDHEHGLPIRFEAYDWPKHPGAAPELIEEYTYMDLRTTSASATTTSTRPTRSTPSAGSERHREPDQF